MKKDILLVNFIIDGKYSVIPTKAVYDQLNDDDIIVYYEVNLDNKSYTSKETYTTEYAILNFQSILPQNIKIACCQSCRHGNFCPYGCEDNELFCLKGRTPSNKMDVCGIFSDYHTGKDNWLSSRSRKLLDFCIDYSPIDSQTFYTYNDWDYYIK